MVNFGLLRRQKEEDRASPNELKWSGEATSRLWRESEPLPPDRMRVSSSPSTHQREIGGREKERNRVFVEEENRG